MGRSIEDLPLDVNLGGDGRALTLAEGDCYDAAQTVSTR
jgi:hypothetical protein